MRKQGPSMENNERSISLRSSLVCMDKYLLVMTNTFSAWTEDFPTKAETAQITVKKKKKTFTGDSSQFDLPLILMSDNGPAFTAKISKLK
jgi:hypothetical protein